MRDIDIKNMFMVQPYDKNKPSDYTLQTFWAYPAKIKCMFDSINPDDKYNVVGLACPCGKCSVVCY